MWAAGARRCRPPVGGAYTVYGCLLCQQAKAWTAQVPADTKPGRSRSRHSRAGWPGGRWVQRSGDTWGALAASSCGVLPGAGADGASSEATDDAPQPIMVTGLDRPGTTRADDTGRARRNARAAR